jgi:hypothetical protein
MEGKFFKDDAFVTQPEELIKFGKLFLIKQIIVTDKQLSFKTKQILR